MSVGGATRETAGTLTPGSDNMFNVADATESVWFDNDAWWTFTTTSPTDFTIVTSPDFDGGVNFVLFGDDGAGNLSIVDAYDFIGQTAYYLAPADTYYLVVGTHSGAPDTYQVTYRTRPAAAAPWLSTFRDQTNQLVISQGDLLATNPAEFTLYRPFMYDVVEQGITGPHNPRTTDPPGREGNYLVQEVLSGADIDADPQPAADCAWTHAEWGDVDLQQWNTTTTDINEHGPPVCRPIFDVGEIADPVNNNAPSRSVDYRPQAPFAAANVRAQDRLQLRALWFIAARTGLIDWSGPNWPRGVLSMASVDPVADGVPASAADTAVLEWEDELELLGVEVTGDRGGRDDDVAHGISIFLNDRILPFIGSESGEWESGWRKGVLGLGEGGVDPRPFLTFDYQNGDPDWHEVEGVSSWEDCKPYDGTVPDATVGICITDKPDVEEFIATSGDIAVRFTFRSPRYRWIYPQTTVVRQAPRDDTQGTSSAPRLWPPSKSSRLAGGYPGGSGA